MFLMHFWHCVLLTSFDLLTSVGHTPLFTSPIGLVLTDNNNNRNGYDILFQTFTLFILLSIRFSPHCAEVNSAYNYNL